MKPGVFIGLAGLDIVYNQNVIPLENKKSKTNHYNAFVGGPAANAAVTYALLGGKSILVTCIGNSEIGRMIKRELTEDYGIEIIDFAGIDEVLPNISSISVNVENASRTIWSGQQLFQISNEYDVSEIVEKGLFFLTDCNLLEISTMLLLEAKRKGKPIVLDAGSWKEKFEDYLSVADDVIASSDCKPENLQEDLFQAAFRYGAKNVAVTNGEKPIHWRSTSNSGMIEPKRVEAKDTLGAGDVFHGAYCYFKFMKNLSFEDALKSASEVASSSVQFFGPRRGVREYLNLKVNKLG